MQGGVLVCAGMCRRRDACVCCSEVQGQGRSKGAGLLVAMVAMADGKKGQIIATISSCNRDGDERELEEELTEGVLLQ